MQNLQEKLRDHLIPIVIFTLAFLVWGGVGFLISTNLKTYTSSSSLFLAGQPVNEEIPVDSLVTSLIQEYQEAYQKFRDERGFTNDIPLIIFDVRSDEAFLQKHITHSSLTTPESFGRLSQQKFFVGKTIVVVVPDEDNVTEELKEILTTAFAKQTLVWPAKVLERLPNELITTQ